MIEPTYDALLKKELSKLKLNSDELSHLRRIVDARCALSNTVAKLTHIFENAAAATSFIESLQNRVTAVVWKKMAKQRKAL